MKIASLLPYLFCAASGALLARYELHTDDTGVEVFFIFAIAFILGCWHPKSAWQWSLLVGPWAPAADLCQLVFGSQKPGVSIAGGLAAVTIVVILVGLAGSYCGALIRKGISAAASHAM